MSEIDIYKHIGQQSGQQMISDREKIKELEERINKTIIHITNIFRDENWYKNYDYDDLVIALKDTLGILRGDK